MTDRRREGSDKKSKESSARLSDFLKLKLAEKSLVTPRNEPANRPMGGKVLVEAKAEAVFL